MKKPQEFEINYFQDEAPAIRGRYAWGKTLKECYRNTVEAIESCLEAWEKIVATDLRRG